MGLLPDGVARAILAQFDHANRFFDLFYGEPGRQRRLTESLGQVTCSEDEHAHDVENLPCRHCGAAL